MILFIFFILFNKSCCFLLRFKLFHKWFRLKDSWTHRNKGRGIVSLHHWISVDSTWQTRNVRVLGKWKTILRRRIDCSFESVLHLNLRKVWRFEPSWGLEWCWGGCPEGWVSSSRNTIFLCQTCRCIGPGWRRNRRCGKRSLLYTCRVINKLFLLFYLLDICFDDLFLLSNFIF